MTPKEKADALVLKFSNLINFDFVSDLKFHNPNDNDRNRRVKKDAKQCALVAVYEIIQQNNVWIIQTNKGTNNYWEQVIIEIEKL
jgi:hypothetical protein